MQNTQGRAAMMEAHELTMISWLSNHDTWFLTHGRLTTWSAHRGEVSTRQDQPGTGEDIKGQLTRQICYSSWLKSIGT